MEDRLLTVLVNASNALVPETVTTGLASVAAVRLVAVTVALRSYGVLTHAVSVPVIPSVPVSVVVPENAVPVFITHPTTTVLAGNANKVTLWVTAAALATVLVVPSGLVMRKFALELATVHLPTCKTGPGAIGVILITAVCANRMQGARINKNLFIELPSLHK